MKTIKNLSSWLLILILAGLMSVQAQDAAKPVSGISWKTNTIDLGKIEQGKPVTVEFEFTNPSMVPLIVMSVRPSCGCTTTDYPKNSIDPGKSGTIKITYNAASSGAFTKSTSVTTNAGDANSTLIIKGEVIAKSTN
jgi:hypothetical protein